MEKRIKKFAEEYRLKNGKIIYTLTLCTLLNKYFANIFLNYKNCKKTIDKLILQKKTMLDFIWYLLKNKKFRIKKYSKLLFFSMYKFKLKKHLFEECGRSFLNMHTCLSSYIRNRNYLEVSLPKLPQYSEIIDIILDIECCFINNYHVPVLLCIKYQLNQIDIEKTFLTVESFFNWLKLFALNECKINCRINLIGFNSSRYDFIFFMKEIRKYVSQNWIFQKNKYNYIQKGGAIIYNTFYIGSVSIWFIDILRYTGGVTSLKQIAADLQISEEKGAYPFRTMHLSYDQIKLDLDGFFDSKYFDDIDTYFISKQLWFKHNCCSFFKLLEIYCKQDVIVTFEIWKKIQLMYFRYVPFIKDEHITKFHGAPSLTKWISLKYAFQDTNLTSIIYYNKKTKFKKKKMYGANYDSFFLWEESVYGGWVGCHQQGIIKGNLGMIDIVSHYPTSFTSYFGIGKPRPMTIDELVYFSNNIEQYDLNSIPIFCCRVKVFPPKQCEISDFCSPLPQRCKHILTWSYLKCDQTLNSIDIWNCAKFYKFKFQLLSGEIFTKKALIFKDFVACFAKMKDDGKLTNNKLKTKCGKIGLNSGIGKYGEKKERLISKIIKTDFDLKEVNLLLSMNNKYINHSLVDIISHSNYEEYIIKEFDVTNNNIPLHIISIMFAYSRVIKMDLIRKCKLNNYSIFSSKNNIPDIKYGDTDSLIITARVLKHLKKNSPTLFQPSIGFYDTFQKTFLYHIETEKLFVGRNSIPQTRFAILFGFKAYMIITTVGSKYKCKGHRIAEVKENCSCQSGDKKWFCIGCLQKNFDNEEEINVCGVTLQHFYNSVKGGTHKFQYLRFEKNLNRPIGKGKYPFTVKNKYVTISLNFKDLNHKYDVINNICYPFTQLE